ncbi:MAG: M20/M25/M40 family metallo-hydrolase [Candidatus Edwardsbacteria bacterium]|nr:M20/M25/M40 family metallo-hydrolase [Candidatus Edwardsbacteria bacterium]
MRKFLFGAIGVAVSVYAVAAPVLVSVELPTIESKNAWYQLNIPTYELIGNTAIAQADESQISLIKHKGYQINIIDQQSDLAKYVTVSDVERIPELPGTPIWQNDKTAIIRAVTKDTMKDIKYKHQIRPFNTKPLGDRFWKSVTTKYVPLKNMPYDPFIKNLVDQVNADSISATIQRLQDLGTRFIRTDSSAVASQWLKDKYTLYGFSTQLDSFYLQDSTHERNVIANLPGTNGLFNFIMISGHFDATSVGNPDSCAPGANDDASGTAIAVEVARVMKDHSWPVTISCIGWGAEESGCIGSLHFAERADSVDMDIKALLNFDMVGYMNDAVQDVNFAGTYWLTQLCQQTAQIYASSLVTNADVGNVSDDYSFSNRGFPALGCIENPIPSVSGGYPYYHQYEDLLKHLSPELYTNVAKVAVAATAYLALCPDDPDLTVCDVGNASQLAANWTSSADSCVEGFWIFWGTTSGNYSDSLWVAGRTTTTDTIGGLMADTTYYIIIRADNGSYQSLFPAEVTGTPRLAPLAPPLVLATPQMAGIRVEWQKSTELDFVGYKLYRTLDDTMAYGQLPVGTITDTFYTDTPLSGAFRYYYRVQSIDRDSNHSPYSATAYSRPITLDQGILMVDETQNWTSGSFPRDAQQDSFYQYILNDFKHTNYEYDTPGNKTILADYVPYSTVVWFADDYSQFMASSCISDIQTYLEYGGKLWFAGWRPAGDIKNSIVYPADFITGSFLYDYFKITHAELSGTADSFNTAVGLQGYPDINVDTLKYPSTIWGKTLRYIEALTPTATGDTIYVIDMKNDGSSYEGKACAVRDSGKMVFFGFPLYFMDKEQAKLAAQKVMAEFGEPSGVSGKLETGNRITEIRLFQNAPNPFNNKTTIRYQLPKAGSVKLSVYNIAGQLVETLVNGEQQTGSYTINWDRKDNNNKQVSAGVYIYHLNTGDKTQTRKMVVLK